MTVYATKVGLSVCVLQRWICEFVCYKGGFVNVYATKVGL